MTYVYIAQVGKLNTKCRLQICRKQFYRRNQKYSTCMTKEFSEYLFLRHISDWGSYLLVSIRRLRYKYKRDANDITLQS